MKKTVVLTALACAFSGFLSSTSAQEFPNKPIRIVVPFPAGGTSDILTRLIGAKMAEHWKQQVLADNRPGANGNIGADIVARSAPDGHTLVLMDVGSLAISPSVFVKMPFDIIKDFAPVTVVSYSPHLLVSHPSVPVKTAKDIVALAKAQPGKLNYAAVLGGAPHMAGMMFAHQAGIKWLDIPTKGGAQAILSTITGESDILFNGMLATLPHVNNGKLKLIAVSSDKRHPSIPNTPTVAESAGLSGFITGSWQGILAPARTPPALVSQLRNEVVRIINLPDVKGKMSSQGADPIGNQPEEMAKWLAAEKERWARLIKSTGFKLQG